MTPEVVILQPFCDLRGELWIKIIPEDCGPFARKLDEMVDKFAAKYPNQPFRVDYSAYFAWEAEYPDRAGNKWLDIPHPSARHSGSLICSNCNDLPTDEEDWLAREEYERAIAEQNDITPDDPFAQERAEDLREDDRSIWVVEGEQECANCGNIFMMDPSDFHLIGLNVICPECASL